MNRSGLAMMLLLLCDPSADAQWQQQTIKTEADFRGLSVVSAKVAWFSGTKGTYARTTDAGKSWTVGTVPDSEKLNLRDVEAFGENAAYLLSAGTGRDLESTRRLTAARPGRCNSRTPSPKPSSTPWPSGTRRTLSHSVTR